MVSPAFISYLRGIHVHQRCVLSCSAIRPNAFRQLRHN